MNTPYMGGSEESYKYRTSQNMLRNQFPGEGMFQIPIIPKANFTDKGIRVIPTVNWGDESTFDFCFLGIPKGSTVMVSTYMVSAHDNRADQKEFFMEGYRKMLSRIEPERRREESL